MKTPNSILKELKGILGTMLISERMNTQRCLAKDIDTTKTIIDHNEKETGLSQEELNKVGIELSSLLSGLKGLGIEFLMAERMNTQRCLAKDIDTTKTIIDYKEEDKEFNSEDIKELAKEAKGILDNMLISERMNTQRCLAKDIDTTKTIIDKKEDHEDKEELDSMIEELKGLLGTMLISERTNTQRCIAKDIDTTKTIIDQK